MRNSLTFVTILHISVISAFNAFADGGVPVIFSATSGSTEFRATGHPSSLHVVGKGVGPIGEIQVGKTTSDGVLSFDLTTLDTGIETRDEHMKAKYLEVEKYPKAQLTISKMAISQDQITKPSAITDAPFQGTLLLHGTSKPVTGTVSIQGDGQGTLNLDSKFSLKLSDFGIAVPVFAGITVADQVQIQIISKPHFSKSN